ncbi:hypothetical protein LEP1GSC049_1604 [Leptospira kirschneri serovar Cynopteri str. 3522 CT]|nr:hypothetical protein LEP1GSC042_3861 [Leptospira kirschneri serovar Bim str. PUO 1247]EMN06383.1 hypothetical protein LEP1GSC046_1084 [Leptospira kirschneri serovar Bim str. 1051]EMO82363.1 hypothetical protein LEP1GSC126_1554 [Leptospira kirschneri str. 200801774]EPG49024.1 hypothetical protein LEP1GSC049_1604 [Leptospira kirschneri serovar Cynopteri str. 3522 CT]
MLKNEFYIYLRYIETSYRNNFANSTMEFFNNSNISAVFFLELKYF